MERIRLMIVDDYDPIRIGLRSTFELEEDIEVVETMVMASQPSRPPIELCRMLS